MEVNIIAHTVPEDSYINVKEFVAYCARVSNPGNQNNNATADKLLNYLQENDHWSPFEMANVVMEIKTTRDIGRQILRHRSFSFQEFSQRYAVVDLDFEFREFRLQDPKNRQNSISIDDNVWTHEDSLRRDKLLALAREWEYYQREVQKISERAYRWAIKNGIAKEQARCVLPEGMTRSTMYMNGTIRSWLHYIDLRSANGTQKEHQDIAIACAKELGKVFA